jgi:hypothetical protein
MSFSLLLWSSNAIVETSRSVAQRLAFVNHELRSLVSYLREDYFWFLIVK